MPSDVKLFKKDYGWYIDFEYGDIALTNGLDTALYMSIFCQVRALAEEISDPLKRRGHFTNIFSDVEGYEVGSKMWLYTERVANTERNAELIKNACKDGLQWLITDNIIKNFKVEVLRKSSQIQINIELKITDEETLYREAFINTFK
jgi:phage gp46-like protein